MSLDDWDIKVTSSPELEEVVVNNKEEPSKKFKMTTTNLVHGVPYPLACSAQRWENLDKHTQYKPGDILIVSYPKCGTTWSEQTVLLLTSGGDPSKLNPRFKNSYTASERGRPGKIWIEMMVEQDPSVQLRMGGEGAPLSWDDFNAAPSPRVIKSHAPTQLLLGSAGKGLEGIPDFVKVLIVTRNPLDACVSSYYHAFNPHTRGWSFDAWAKVWMTGNFAHGDYFDWVKNWREQFDKLPHRAIWIEYENMLLDQRKTLEDIAKYLDVPADDGLIERVLQYSSFKHMKEQTEQAGGDTLGHLRKGVSGDWKNHFSQEIYDAVAQRFRDELGSTGLSFPSF